MSTGLLERAEDAVTVTVDALEALWAATVRGESPVKYAELAFSSDLLTTAPERPERRSKASSSLRMNPAIRDRWCDELLSGRWEKVQGTFSRGNNERCAMGVLLYEVLGKGWSCCPMCDRDAVAARCGMTIGAYEKMYAYVVSLNDVCGKSFPEIAEYIRERW